MGDPGKLYEAVLGGAREAIARLDINAHHGLHPRVGVLDVAPIVYLSEDDRGAACAEALVLAEELDVRALGLRLTDGIQVSPNIEDHPRATAAEVVAAVRAHAPVTGAELVAPAPRAALADFPEDVPLRGPKPLEDHLLS